MKRIFALCALALAPAAAAPAGLFAARICAPDQYSVYVNDKAQKWMPTLKADLSRQLQTLSKAYRLNEPCSSGDAVKFRYLLIANATDPIAGGGRGYVVHLAVTEPDAGFTAYYDFTVGVASGTATNTRVVILGSARELIDEFAVAYSDANP